MRRRAVAFIVALAVLHALAPRAADARDALENPPAVPSSSSSAEPGSDLRIYLMTFSAGSLIYEKFGHNTICVHDPAPAPELVERREAFERDVVKGRVRKVPPFSATDRAYHYGAFDFEQESFVWRFLHGRMDYWMQSEWADVTALMYAADNRAVLLQELDLPPARKMEIQQFLEWNERSENRVYRYDYYRDNCSTRVRDVIDRGAGGELERQLKAVRTDATYRSHTRRLTATLDPEGLFWFTSFTYVLGQPVDEPLTAWEEAFLPDALSAHVRNVRLPDGQGGTRPLVSREIRLTDSTRPDMPPVAPRRTVAYGIAGLLVGAAFFGLAALAASGSRAGRWGFMLLVVPWLLLWGAGATIGTYGWAATDHAASYRNENLLQMTPFMLPLMFLAPALAFGRRWAGRLGVALAVAGAALAVLGLLLKVLPAFWQHNVEIIALAVPSNIGLAAGLIVLARRTRSTSQTATPGAELAAGATKDATSSSPSHSAEPRSRGRKRRGRGGAVAPARPK